LPTGSCNSGRLSRSGDPSCTGKSESGEDGKEAPPDAAILHVSENTREEYKRELASESAAPLCRFDIDQVSEYLLDRKL
jgi:hypothetical protein